MESAYINSMALGFLIFGLIIAGAALLFATSTIIPKVLGGICWFLTVAGVVWLVYAANQPWEIDRVDHYDIKMVIFPDGSKQQMFTCDDRHVNVTSMFNKIAPDGWVVRRTKYKWCYCGISFWQGDEAGNRKYTSFELIRRD